MLASTANWGGCCKIPNKKAIDYIVINNVDVHPLQKRQLLEFKFICKEFKETLLLCTIEALFHTFLKQPVLSVREWSNILKKAFKYMTKWQKEEGEYAFPQHVFRYGFVSSLEQDMLKFLFVLVLKSRTNTFTTLVSIIYFSTV